MSRLRAFGAPTCVVGLALALGGCVNLAPEYHRPNPVTPDIWPIINGRADANNPNTIPVAALGWRQFFLDDRLRRVVELALARNQNLRIAALDIEKAREQYREAGAPLFPTISGSGNVDISRSTGGNNTTSTGISSQSGSSGNGNTGRGGGISYGSGSGVSKRESVELGFASFELDFFGQLRNEAQAALESLRSSAATRRSTQISLIAEVANDWLTLSSDQELLALAKKTLTSQEANYRLVQARHHYGIATGIDLANARSTVESARVSVATYVAQVAQDRDALNLVVGATVPVADLPGAKVPAHPVVTRLPANVPSSVLANRPDVLAAEYTLRADYADIGAARAAFFPTISLTSSIGFATEGLSGLFKGSNRTWSVSPQVDIPIFDAGANRAALNITKIQRQIDVANYQQAIQTAFSEVADALATRATIHQQVTAQKAFVASIRRAYRLSLASYKNGIDSYIDVLQEQQTLYSAQQTDVGKRLAQQVNLITLYKVLGGGGLAGAVERGSTSANTPVRRPVNDRPSSKASTHARDSVRS